MIEHRIVHTSKGKFEVICVSVVDYGVTFSDYWVRSHECGINAILTHDDKIKGIGSTNQANQKLIYEAVKMFKENMNVSKYKPSHIKRIK